MTEFQEQVYHAVERLEPNAYGVTIHKEVEALRKRSVSLGGLYVALAQLEEMGLLRSRMGEATAERGWRPKRYYDVCGRPKEAPSRRRLLPAMVTP